MLVSINLKDVINFKSSFFSSQWCGLHVSRILNIATAIVLGLLWLHDCRSYANLFDLTNVSY